MINIVHLSQLGDFYKFLGIITLSRINDTGFISANFAAGREIYFVFDLSSSITDESLNNSLEFAHNLVRRVSVYVIENYFCFHKCMFCYFAKLNII